MTDDVPQDRLAPASSERLMPIGIFARVTGLSHRALRLYAERGLLLPARVDADTGYRSYDVHSIRAAEMIRLLRRLGVPLSEMRLYIEAAAADDLAETIARQKSRLEQEQARLAASTALLGKIGELDAMFRAAPAIDLVDLPAQPCLRWCGTMPRAEFHESYIELAGELAAEAARRDLQPAGREVVVLRDPTEIGLAGGDETVLNYELCLPVDGPLSGPLSGPPGEDHAAGVVLEGGRFARSVFTGLYEDGYRFAYARQLEWLADSGLALSGLLRMRFARDERDTEDPAEFATELLWPVAAPPAQSAGGAATGDLSRRWLTP